MGQENTCGICGKYYQSCRHYIKDHIPNSEGKALCGLREVLIMDDDWTDCDIDMDDVCKNCLKYYGIKI